MMKIKYSSTLRHSLLLVM